MIEEVVKNPDWPDIGSNVTFHIDEIKEFFSKDKEIIKNHLNKIDGSESRFGFSISCEEMCLMTSADNIRLTYKIMRDELINISSMIMKSNISSLIVESVDIPIFQDKKLTCSMHIKFKRK